MESSNSGSPLTAPRRAAAIVLVALGSGIVAACGGAAAPPAAPEAHRAPVLTNEDRHAMVEAKAQRDAQRTWCAYLEALYLRAADGATSWPRFQQCTEITTMAAPEMLRRTADCSLEALRQFPGDPFTMEYASEVSRCGAMALDAMALEQSEVAPFVSAICTRASSCGQVQDFGECREHLASGIGHHLGRAVGAMNRRGREQLRSCLRTASCTELGTQISACLEPIMDALLWLPS